MKRQTNLDKRIAAHHSRFDAQRDKFDRDFERAQKTFWVAWVIGGIVSVGGLVGVGYVIIRVFW